jgi:VWFA-related protein
MSRRLGVFVMVLIAAPPALVARQAPAQSPAFRAATLLIVQNVVVKDKQGRPIAGLTASDFIVTEDGVPQPIAFVEFQNLDAPPLGAAEIAPSVPALASTTLAPITAVGDAINTVPLPGDHRYRGKRLIVLYLDLQALPFFDEGRVFDGVRAYLARDMTAADVVSVAVYQHSRVRVKIDFTDDRTALRRVIDELEQESLDAELGGGGVEFDPGGGAFGEDGGEFNMFAMDRRLAALQTTVANLGPLPERKTLVYFGGAISANVENLAQLRATVNAAVRANVTINPVDPGGLTASAPLGNATRPSPGGVAMFSGQIAQRAISRQQAAQDVYYALAKDTGGVATLNNNDLSMGIAAAAKAVTGYYMIGYYTTNAAKDGRFRRVKVALVGSHADADLSFRPGYFGAKEWARFNSYDKERHLEEALRLEDPITEIPMAVEVNYFQISSAEYFVPISVRMPGSELTRPRPSGDTRAVIDMIAEVKDEYGVTMRNSRDKLEFRLDAAMAGQSARRPIQYEAGFSVLPGNYLVKVLARDQATGRIGTFIQKFVVPNLERETQRLPISTVVLATQRVAPAAALYTVQQKIAATVAHPLIHDGLQLIPSVGRTFSASMPLFIFLQAYEREADAARPLVAFATFYRDGVKSYETEIVSVDVWDPKTRALPIRLGVPAGRLPPGPYDCQVTVLDPGTNRAAFWRAPIIVVR